MASSVTLRQLEYLVAVVDAGTFTSAAKTLHVSQSALSMAIADLERVLGVQLLVRRPRGVAPTKVCERVLTKGRHLLAGVEDLRNAAREAHESMSGRLMIGCYSTLSPTLMPPVISDFIQEHPGVDLQFFEGSHAYLAQLLRDGILDLALVYRYERGGSRADPDLVHTKVLRSAPYVLLPAGHRLSDQSDVSLEELESEPLILFDLPPGGEYFRSLFAAEGRTPAVRFSTSSFEMVRALVARGLGYSILSQETQIHLSYEGLEYVTRPLRADPTHDDGLDIEVVQLAGARPTLRAEVFVRRCTRTIQARFHPWPDPEPAERD